MGIFDFIFNRKKIKKQRLQEQIELQKKQENDLRRQEQLDHQKSQEEQKRQLQVGLRKNQVLIDQQNEQEAECKREAQLEHLEIQEECRRQVQIELPKKQEDRKKCELLELREREKQRRQEELEIQQEEERRYQEWINQQQTQRRTLPNPKRTELNREPKNDKAYPQSSSLKNNTNNVATNSPKINPRESTSLGNKYQDKNTSASAEKVTSHSPVNKNIASNATNSGGMDKRYVKDEISRLEIKLDDLKHDIEKLLIIEDRIEPQERESIQVEIQTLLLKERGLKKEISSLQTSLAGPKDNNIALKLNLKNGEKQNQKLTDEFNDARKIENWSRDLQTCKVLLSQNGIDINSNNNPYTYIIVNCERILKGYKLNGYITYLNANSLQKSIEELKRSSQIYHESEQKQVVSEKTKSEERVQKPKGIISDLPAEQKMSITNNNVEQIKKIIETRNLNYLIHFSRVENLWSILEHGLVPVSLQKNKINSIHNDEQRIDKRLDCTSCSVGFPNYKLLYYFKENKYAGSKWVLILLDTKVLYSPNRRIYFCNSNAASVLHQVKNIKELCSPNSFETMFSEKMVTKGNRVIERRDLRINSDYPTDPQAEILISDVIEPKHISAIYFNTESDLDDYICEKGTDLLKLFNYQIQPSYFAPRKDYVFW